MSFIMMEKSHRRGQLLLLLVAAPVFLLLASCGAPRTSAPAAELYAVNCAGCHGPAGRADGPAAPFLYPRPRNFTSNIFRFGGAPSDIRRTVRRGIPGTSMPPFESLLKEDQIDLLAGYVRRLAGGETPEEEAPAPPVPAGIGRVAQGAKLFTDACASCHGPEGHGDGPSAGTMKDEAGIPIRPIDLTSAPLKGGEAPQDIYLRLLRGVPGTPMPSYEGALKPEQMWDVVAYVLSRRRQPPAPPAADRITVRRVDRLPESSQAGAWEKMPRATLRLQPLWQRPEWPPNLSVRACHDGRKVRFLLEWPDRTEDRTLGRMDDFTDAVALMVPAGNGPAPFIGMGGWTSEGNPPTGSSSAAGLFQVNIWQWRAVRSDAMGPSEIHPYMIRDSNPLESLPFTRPAAVAGNPLSPGLALSETGSALLQYLADGPGHLTPVPPDLRRGRAAGIFREGSWHVTLDLDETDPSPAVLRPGMHGLVALAVWNGAAHDRNGQKTITPWVALEVEE